VAFFSTYTWNFRLSLEIARSLNNLQPETLIVFGGPSVPDRVHDFLVENTFIDVACHGEGEQSALAILENWQSRNWEGIEGISYIREDGTVCQQPKAPRMLDLSTSPSPYLEGVFAPLMAANPDEQWIACWETNRGCPFSCTFCDWGSATQSKVYSFEIDRLNAEMNWFGQNKIEYVFCCDANFGILARDVELATHAAETKKKYGFPHPLSAQNTKNATERAYQTSKILADAGLSNGVAIALQSMDETTLKSIKRDNISLQTYLELQRRFARDGIETYTDMILGLPGETYDSFANGVSNTIEAGQHNRIQFANLSVIDNAEMGDPEYQKRYGMVAVESETSYSHASLSGSSSEVAETQSIVVATNSMPKEDWIKTRVYAWMTALLIFDKILDIPLVLAHKQGGLEYRTLIEAFSEGSLDDYPVLAEIRSFFVQQALTIQNGGQEFVGSEQWLNSWWQADEYMVIKLCTDNNLQNFYAEAERRLLELFRKKQVSFVPDMLHDAAILNQNLIKLPFQAEDLDLHLSYNIWEFYKSVLTGDEIAIEKEPSRNRIDRTSDTWTSWDDWCREVVWYGHKRGAYFYGNAPIQAQLSGHH